MSEIAAAVATPPAAEAAPQAQPAAPAQQSQPAAATAPAVQFVDMGGTVEGRAFADKLRAEWQREIAERADAVTEPGKPRPADLLEAEKLRAAEAQKRASELEAEVGLYKFQETFAKEASRLGQSGIEFASEAARAMAAKIFREQFQIKDGAIFTADGRPAKVGDRLATFGELMADWRKGEFSFLFKSDFSHIDGPGAQRANTREEPRPITEADWKDHELFDGLKATGQLDAAYSGQRVDVQRARDAMRNQAKRP